MGFLKEAKNKSLQQKMGLLNLDCITLSPPSSNVSANLAVPFSLYYEKQKMWILINLCNVSKAQHSTMDGGKNVFCFGNNANMFV